MANLSRLRGEELLLHPAVEVGRRGGGPVHGEETDIVVWGAVVPVEVGAGAGRVGAGLRVVFLHQRSP